jgi:hypothetical protein
VARHDVVQRRGRAPGIGDVEREREGAGNAPGDVLRVRRVAPVTSAIRPDSENRSTPGVCSMRGIDRRRPASGE